MGDAALFVHSNAEQISTPRGVVEWRRGDGISVILEYKGWGPLDSVPVKAKKRAVVCGLLINMVTKPARVRSRAWDSGADTQLSNRLLETSGAKLE